MSRLLRSNLDFTWDRSSFDGSSQKRSNWLGQVNLWKGKVGMGQSQDMSSWNKSSCYCLFLHEL